MAEKYFLYPFGVDGNLLAIPDPTQISGAVSYQQGFPIGYEEANTSPGYLPIPRDQFNQLMFDVTSALQQIQQTGFPSFITSAANGGSPFSYAIGAEVWSAGVPYRSLIAGNTDTPPTSNWEIIGQNRSLYFNYAVDTGTTNNYVIAPDPAMLSYVGGNVIELRPAFANTGACNVNVSGLGLVNIKTLQNQDPAAGMIIPAGIYSLVYNDNTGCFVLQNPSLGTAAYVNTGVGASQVPLNSNLGTAAYQNMATSSGKVVLGGTTIQWGSVTITSTAVPQTYSFPTAFSGIPNVVATINTYAVVVNQPTPPTATQFTLEATGGSTLYWQAIGPT